MKEAIKDSRRGGVISKQLPPVFYWSVRRNERAFS